MAQYIVTDTELGAVADAIREKGGTSADLEWYSDFVDAIEAIEGGGGAEPYLPSEYQEVEYVASSETGTQYIETGISPSFDTEVIVDYKMIATKSDNNAVLMGSRVGSDTSKRFFPVSYTNSTTNERHVMGTRSLSMEWTYSMRHRVEYNTPRHEVIVDDFPIGTYYPADFIGNLNTVWLYGAHDLDDELTFHVRAKIYSVIAIDHASAEKTHELIPCYRKADGVIGFYDAINDVFRTNLGDGTLEKGDDVYNHYGG